MKEIVLRLRWTFIHTGETAQAVVRMRDAPVTCQALWNRLPVAGVCHHASYSGSEGVLILPETLRMAPENATHEVEPGDIGFTWFEPGQAYGVTKEFAEVCWFYDSDARPSMHEGPAPVNLFARFEGDTTAFFARSRAMRRQGVTGLLIERLDVPDRGMPVAYHDPAREAPILPRQVVVGHAERGPDVRDRMLAIVGCGERCRVLYSHDRGATWQLGPDVGPGTTGSVAVGRGGDVWVAMGHHTQGPILVASGMDGLPAGRRRYVGLGADWKAVRDTGFVGACPTIAAMPNGDLVMLWETDPGIAGARSQDGGRSWVGMETGIEAHDASRPVALPCMDGRLICAFCGPGADAGAHPTHLTVIGD